MEKYSHLLERIRVPQPPLQRFAVTSIFEKLNIDGLESDSAGIAISHCLSSSSSAVIEQSIRELCRAAKEGKIRVSQALIELQAALEGCEDKRMVDIFVKGIGFLCRLGFRNNPSWRFESAEAHPFVKVISAKTETRGELLRQMLLFLMEDRPFGFTRALGFLDSFLIFSVLSIPFSFPMLLISSLAKFCCCFPLESVPIMKAATKCLKYFPCGNAEEFEHLLYSFEHLVDASVIILKKFISTGSSADELPMCSVELLHIVLSPCTDLQNSYARSEQVIKISGRLLSMQKELGLLYVPEFTTILSSLFIILTQAEFENEQLSTLNLSFFLLKWKVEKENGMGRDKYSFLEEIVFIFTVINLITSPSVRVKAIAVDFLSFMERHITYISVAPKNLQCTTVQLPSTCQLGSIIFRLMHHLWTQDNSSLSSFYLNFACNAEDNGGMFVGKNSWASGLGKYSYFLSLSKKSSPASQSGIPFLLCSLVAALVMHPKMGSSAVDSLSAMGLIYPRVGISLLLSVLFYSKVFCTDGYHSPILLLNSLGILPSLASQSVMAPVVVQTILPMLQKDTRSLLYATAVRLLCQTWKVTDRIFDSLLGVLQPTVFSNFVAERNICISMAASVRDVCRKNPDRGVDLILSVSECIESRDPIIQALGFESLGHLCEADVVDFYTAWDVIANNLLDYSLHPSVAYGLSLLLKWGALDAEVYPDASKNVVNILWKIANSRCIGCEEKWIKARILAFASLNHYKVEDLKRCIPNFNMRNLEMLLSEYNIEVLEAIESLEIKILIYEHSTRRRFLKGKRVTKSKVVKLVDVFPDILFSKANAASNMPGAYLLSLAFNPKNTLGLSASKESADLHSAYINVLKEIAESLQLSRNIVVAMLSLQSWKAFMQCWIRTAILSSNEKITSKYRSTDLKACDAILQSICDIAEESIPRTAENMVLAIGAMCMVLPSSAHPVTSTASKFLLKWLNHYEHEHRQWPAAISLGLVCVCLHTTESNLKFEIINALLEVSSKSKSTMVKGACGLGMGFACLDLLPRVEATDDSQSEKGIFGVSEMDLRRSIIKALCSIISMLCPTSLHSLQSLCQNISCMEDVHSLDTLDLSGDSLDKQGDDIWAVTASIMGLVHVVIMMYHTGALDSIFIIKDMLLSWIPHISSTVSNPSACSERPELALSVGSCLVLPTVVALCQKIELMDHEIDDLVNGYKSLITELTTSKTSGLLYESLLMASCIGAGNLLSCILNEGVHVFPVDDVKGLLDLMRNTYCQPNPPLVVLGGMLGIVNSIGAGALVLPHAFPHYSPLQIHHPQKESHQINGPLLSNSVCESFCTSLMQEIFVAAQDSKNSKIQKNATWAISFLWHQWSSENLQHVNASENRSFDHKLISSDIAEDSTVWKLCSWLMDLNQIKVKTVEEINSVVAVLRCLSHAPRLPSFDWGAILRRCMKFEDQISNKLTANPNVQKGILREECIRFSLAHANNIIPLVSFMDELCELSSFRMLELNLQSCLLSHLADILQIFSASRGDKLFGDMINYFFSSISCQDCDMKQRSLLRISFWKGLCHCLEIAFTEFQKFVPNIVKCMEGLFLLLPVFIWVDFQREDQGIYESEWNEAVKCFGKAPKEWLVDYLKLPELSLLGRSLSIDSVRSISTRARLVHIDCLPVTELSMIIQHILNTELNGIWRVHIEVVVALEHAEGNIKRQWLLDAVEISLATRYPSTALHFIGLLSGRWCKYMPLLIVDEVAVLSDLPVTLPSLLSDSNWNRIAETLVLNFWLSTERIYTWAMQLATNGDLSALESIDRSENSRSLSLARIMHETCFSLKRYLPFEKQLRLAKMVIP